MVNVITTPDRKRVAGYALVILLPLLLGTYLVLHTSFLSLSARFLALQTFALVWGILHAWLLGVYLPTWRLGRPLNHFWLTLLLTVVAMMAVVGLAYRIPGDDIGGRYAWALLLFPLGFLVKAAYHAFLHIPEKIYEPWFYPVGQPSPDLDLVDLSQILLIQFEFAKKPGDPVLTNFKAKAPKQMTLGDLFLLFVNDYNERHPQGPVEYLDARGKPYGWLFYVRSGSWFTPDRYLDHDFNFQQNSLVDNDIIITRRVAVQD
jgi:hypothetical protein